MVRAREPAALDVPEREVAVGETQTLRPIDVPTLPTRADAVEGPCDVRAIRHRVAEPTAVHEPRERTRMAPAPPGPPGGPADVTPGGAPSRPPAPRPPARA
jgi:hypothetical protein